MKKYHPIPAEEHVTAAELRRHIAEAEAEKVRLRQAEARRQAMRAEAHRNAFMAHDFSDDDRQEISRRMRAAIHAGKFEVEVVVFPASYLTDGGRAINNDDAAWPETLTGYARSCYEAYVDLAKPDGYRFLARVLNYPKGRLGDVGLYLAW